MIDSVDLSTDGHEVFLSGLQLFGFLQLRTSKIKLHLVTSWLSICVLSDMCTTKCVLPGHILDVGTVVYDYKMSLSVGPGQQMSWLLQKLAPVPSASLLSG